MKNKMYLIVAVATLIIFTVAGSYAFFQVIGGDTARRSVTVNTETADLLTFNVTDEIEIKASRENFYRNAGSINDSTTATARIVPNSKTNEVEGTYNVYVVIDYNDFVYSTPSKIPELLLTITDPEGNPVTSITGLHSVSNGAFDITTRTGAFLVTKDYEISANTREGTTQEWTMEVTLVNLDTDQQVNTNKTLHGSIYVTKEDLETYSLAQLNSIRTSRINESTGEEVSNIHSTSLTVDVTATAGTEGLDTYYFGIEEASNNTGYVGIADRVIDGVEYFESDEPTYTFTNLKDNTNYNVYAFVEDGVGFASNIYDTKVKTLEYILPSVTSVNVNYLSLSSFKITATSSAGENAVSKYYFDCGTGWQNPQDSSEFTCTGLSYNTNYEVKVKVIDTYGKYSVEYVVPSEITAYEVTYTCNNCSSSKSSDMILAGTSSSSNITANTYYNLTNATVSGCTLTNGVANVSNISSNTECAITARGNEYTITLNNQSATTAGTANMVEKYGESFTPSSITVPARTGYVFGGYYTGTNGSGTQIINGSGSIVANNKTYTNAATLYAYWKPIVTISCTNCTANPTSVTVEYNGSGSSTITAATNYTLTGATVSGCTLSNGVASFSNITAPTTCSISAKASWRCTDGTLTEDATKGASSGGYICVRGYTYSYENETCTDRPCIREGGCAYYSTRSEQVCGTKCTATSCSSYLGGIDYYEYINENGMYCRCDNERYTCWNEDVQYCVYNTCLEYGNCTSWSGTGTYTYLCNNGWSNYSGSGSSLKCYKAATQG